MKIAECVLVSSTPYSQRTYYEGPKLPKESDKDFEARTWKEHCHVDKDGYIFIPPMAFANVIKEAARYLSLPIQGKGKQTYTKHFESGVLVPEPLRLSVTKDTVEGEWVFVPSDGKRGGGRRVLKCFIFIREWKGKVVFYILDDIITEDIFRQVLKTAGDLIGIGRFRPSHWGYYGRFKAEKVTWVAQE